MQNTQSFVLGLCVRIPMCLFSPYMKVAMLKKIGGGNRFGGGEGVGLDFNLTADMKLKQTNKKLEYSPKRTSIHLKSGIDDKCLYFSLIFPLPCLFCF